MTIQEQWADLHKREKSARHAEQWGTARQLQKQILELKPKLQAAQSKPASVPVHKPENVPSSVPSSTRHLTFDQWKVVTSPAGRALLDRVTKIVLEHEAPTHQRQEREQDAANYRKLIHAVVANLIYQDLIHRDTTLPYRMGLRVSRNEKALRSKDTFRYNASFMSKRLTRLLDTLAATDLIVQDVPFKQTSVRSITKQGKILCNETVIYPSGRFIAFLHECKVCDSWADVGRYESAEDREEIVVQTSLAIHEEDAASRLHYEDTASHIQYRKWTRKFNEFLESVQMACCEPLKPSTTTGIRLDLRNRHMKRIFNRGRLDSLGRYYGSTWWLPLSKQERFERIRLAGEPVAELDFSSMLVRLAYGLVGAVPPAGDQYTLEGFERSRDAWKIVFCARLFQRQGNKQKDKRKRLPQDALPLFHPDELRGKEPQDIWDALSLKHPALKPLFGTDVGHSLFFKESQIISEVMAQMVKHSIPFLPVHDAVYVPVSQSEKGKRIMEGLFKGMVGIEGLVRVTRA